MIWGPVPVLRKAIVRPGEYAVGYKKPPRHSQFPKGQSGNPKGRPKRNVDLKAVATKVFAEPVSIRVDGKPMKVTALEASLMNLRTDLLKGDHKAMRLALMIMQATGMIRVPDEPETEEKDLSGEESAMLQELLAEMIEQREEQAGKHE